MYKRKRSVVQVPSFYGDENATNETIIFLWAKTIEILTNHDDDFKEDISSKYKLWKKQSVLYANWFYVKTDDKRFATNWLHCQNLKRGNYHFDV